VDHAWGYGSEQRLREENQDCFGVFDFPDYALAIVCDGMGGHVGGAQASSLAVRTIHDELMELQGTPLPQALEQALQRTNLVIYEAARKNHRLMGMGTTVVLAAVQDGVAYLAHVGDSRCYMVRDSQVTQLTRDHTMVNLFVDAELLTPEDAETHPEAHVLSRSLGVERQVEVEVSEPVELESSDTLILCSDGVHGVVTDWELANVDWGAPHEGIRHVLDIVSARDGDDNATAVAVMLGTSFEDVPPTPVPEPKRFDDHARSALTAVPEEDAYDADSSSGRHTPDSGGASYVVYEDHPILEETQQASTQYSDEGATVEPATADTAPAPAQRQPSEPPQPAPPKPAKAKKSGSKLLPIAVGAAVVAMGLVGVVLLFAGSGSTEVESGEPMASVKVTAPNQQPAQAPAPGEAPAPEAATDGTDGTDDTDDTDDTVEAEAVEMGPLFAPELPPAPRRLPHRPTRYTQPPPGGQVQWVSVQAARNKRCAKALDEVQKGMSTSIDYAALYRGAWLCFVDTHQRPLEQASVQQAEDFIFVLPHFEGAPEERETQLSDPEIAKLPEWYQPAVDGIEFRLERYADSNQSDKLVDVLNDQFGEPTVADQLAKDIHMVALAAVGLSRVETDDEHLQRKVTMWWARRVYVATRAMNGRAGRALERHRPELIPEIRALLQEATTPRELPDETTTTVPDEVVLAKDVALGNAPAPTAKKTVKPTYVPPKEPDLSDLEDELGPTKVERAGDPNFGNN